MNKHLAQMLKGGVVMDVITPEQARIAEAAGACAWRWRADSGRQIVARRAAFQE